MRRDKRHSRAAAGVLALSLKEVGTCIFSVMNSSTNTEDSHPGGQPAGPLCCQPAGPLCAVGRRSDRENRDLGALWVFA